MDPDQLASSKPADQDLRRFKTGYIQLCSMIQGLILALLMDFPIHIDALIIEFSFTYFKGAQVRNFKL